MTGMPQCEVCRKNESVGVASVPGMPVSAAYCLECLKANAHPYELVVFNTATCGGLDNMVEEWKSLVRDTLQHLGKSPEEFERCVSKVLEELEDLPEVDDHWLDPENEEESDPDTW